jgi:hypothetical protein
VLDRAAWLADLPAPLRRLAALVVLFACGGPRPGEQVSIRLALADPLLPVALRVRDAVRPSEAQDLVFETLVSFDEQGGMVPVLADRFERRDATHYRVHLRPALLSDGTPLVADDVIASLAQNRLQARRDGDWLVVESADPGSPLDLWLQQAPIGRQTARGAIGTGPFLAAHEDGAQAVYRRVIPKAGAVNEFVFVNYASDRSAFAHALRGDANFLWLSDPRLLELFEGVPGMQVVRAPGASFTSAAFNVRRFDRTERRALVDALRPDTITAVAFGDECPPRPSSASGAPLPPGRPLDILVRKGDDERLGLVIRRSLGARGGEVRALDTAAFFAAFKAGDYDLALGRPLAFPPPAAALNWRSGSSTNFLGYSNAAADAAIDAADWAGFERALDEDPPAAFLCSRGFLAVVDARIVNPRIGRASLIRYIPDWRVAQ